MSGKLYLCGTPIGNLEDASYRLVRTLSQVDLIAAEDTRNTLKLLNHFEIKTPLTSYHEHNKAQKAPWLLAQLEAGSQIAVVSDAGMPGISDPGADLVRQCVEQNIAVTVIPGPTAAVTGLVLSGLDSRRFVFEGFLPQEKKERRMVLEALQKEHRTMVFYEAPHRLEETLEAFMQTFGASRQMATARELTKKFEEVRRGSIAQIIAHYQENPPKGEFVLLVEGVSLWQQEAQKAEDWQKISVLSHMEHYLSQGMSEKDAMKQVAKDRKVGKREIYRQLHITKEEE